MEKVDSFFHFQPNSQAFLLVGFVLFLLSLFAYVGKRDKLSIWLLFFAALAVRFFAASLDDFLNDWDERFHALVAKNMLENPLHPKLYTDAAINHNDHTWTSGSTWLHKQPLFLWQIALSFKLFGINEWALRLPSVLQSAGIVAIIYRIGSLLGFKRAGYLGAALCTGSWFMNELVSGRHGMDHNDIAFLFYTSASIWSWLEYQRSGKRHWLFLTGLFSGCAILVKWLVGLLVYAAWGISILTCPQKRMDLKPYIKLAQSLGITALIALPWQIWIFTQFPAEASQEYAYNNQHLFKAVEGHGGDWLYHLERIPDLFGPYAWYLILPGILLFVLRSPQKAIRWGVIGVPLVIYAFFSFAATKLPAYPFVSSAILFVFMGITIDHVLSRLEGWISWKFVSPILLVLLVGYGTYSNFNLTKLEYEHSAQQPFPYAKARMANKEIYLRLNEELPANAVVFNAHTLRSIQASFYMEQSVYPFVPEPELLKKLEELGRPVYLFPGPEVDPKAFSGNSTILPHQLQ